MAVLDFNNAAPLKAPASPAEWSARVENLRAIVKANAPGLVAEIFPLAVIKGGKARIGDVQGSAGTSMAIELRGEKAGVWFDHAEVEGGDLIDLWCMGQGYDPKGPDFTKAVEELEQHYGLGMARAPAFAGPVARVAAERAKVPKPPAPLKVAEARYVYTRLNGETLGTVVRTDYADGSKRFFQLNAAGAPRAPEVRPLFHIPQLAAETTVVLVEGEKCVLALEALGVPATTMMGGSGASEPSVIGKHDFAPLLGKRVILWPDNDDTGRKHMGRVATHLAGRGVVAVTVPVPANAPAKWDAADATPEEAKGLLAPLWAATAGEEQAAVIDRGLKLLTVEDLANAPPIEWLIEGVIPLGCLGAIIGPPGGLKTFCVLDMAMAVADDRPYHGDREVRAGAVVYVAGEGQFGLASRVIGWVKSKSTELAGTPFFVVPQAVAMPTGQLDELIALIAAKGVRPKMIVLDTLARTFGAGDENSQKDMNAFVNACDRLRLATGSAVLIVHHTGKDLERGARGSSALPGALDVMIAVKRDGDRLKLICRAPFGKMKDGPEFEDICLQIEKIRFMMHGVEASTLVLIPDESPLIDPDEAPKQERERPGLKNETVLLDRLAQAAEDGRAGLGDIGLQPVDWHHETYKRARDRLKDQRKIRAVEGSNPIIWETV